LFSLETLVNQQFHIDEPADTTFVLEISRQLSGSSLHQHFVMLNLYEEHSSRQHRGVSCRENAHRRTPDAGNLLLQALPAVGDLARQ
jgi:hypothetical protein